MTINVAINGFGRIGRLTFRALLESTYDDISIIAINDLADINSIVHLLKYDSVHQSLQNKINYDNKSIFVNGKETQLFSVTDPENLPWKDLNIDLVIESTGIFTSREKASKHLKAGAKKVLISAPSVDADITVVFGVNEQNIDPKHKIISNGSCTTNCLTPIVYAIEKEIGIINGYMTTVHSVTGDQNTIDTFHKDLRRARNSSLSMIPTSTGAAKAVSEVLPSMKGKLDGSAIRVPTANVSLIDFCFYTQKNTSTDEINNILINYSNNYLKNIISVNSEPLVSTDFNHNPHSSIVDLTETKVLGKNFCRILSWYDNEWGFSNRLLDVTKHIFK